MIRRLTGWKSFYRENSWRREGKRGGGRERGRGGKKEKKDKIGRLLEEKCSR